VERGLMLMKIAAEPSQRREILDLAQIFRAAVVDVGDRSMMLAVTGDPGKTRAFQLAMAKFGVEEVARTGKLALRREVAYSETRRERLQSAQRSRDAPPSPDAQEAASPGKPRAAAPPPAAAPGGDVYKLEASDLTGVWDYAVLAPYWGDGEGVKDTKRGQYKPHTLSLSVENKPGVLDRVTGVIARRGYNVQSLGVGPAERPDISRITLVVPGTDADVEKLRQQLLKVTSVLDAADITHIPFVERELMLVKVAAATRLRGELTDLAAVFRAKVSDISGDTLTIEVTGKNEKLAQLQELLEPYGILEVARTGRVALTRDMGVNTVLLESLADVGDH
jgi:acetolactate synthase I/III small subunit